MQNDQFIKVHHERLQKSSASSSGAKNKLLDTKEAENNKEEPFMAMVVLPSSSSRHSRPLAPPVPNTRPGGAKRIIKASEHKNTIPVAPPRPEHTLTPQSRPIVDSSPSVMELVSLPNLVKGTSPSTKVSLTSPRPEPDREANLYTEAPKKIPDIVLPQNSQSSISVISSVSTLQKSNKVDQPIMNSSIFCQECGKCKCEACCRPRKLPQKWLCGGTCLCSQSTVVDTLSCMCCIKGLFYHCTKDDDEEIDTLDPCSCHGNHAVARWATMATLWPFLPCLLAYPMLGACAKMTEVIYARCTASGCQCQNNLNTELHQDSMSNVRNLSLNKIIDVQPPEKRLLISDQQPFVKPKTMI